MVKSVASLICCALFLGGFDSPERHAQTDRPHVEWLQERYAEATSIKVGMTRAELMKLFQVDGGLQPLLPTRYVLKSSDMIKVDVEFDVPEGIKGKLVPEDEPTTRVDETGGTASPKAKYQVVPNEKLKIRSISKPYLEPFALD